MSDKKIKELYTKLLCEQEFLSYIQNFSLLNKNVQSTDELTKAITKIIVPFSQKLGYDFSEEELLEFEKKQISNEDMAKINGGKISFLKLLINSSLMSSVALSPKPTSMYNLFSFNKNSNSAYTIKKTNTSLINSNEWLKLLPTTKEGTLPYRTIEVNQFADNLKEFPDWYTDRNKAIEEFLTKYPERFEEHKISRNLSREALVAAKKVILISLIDKYPDEIDELKTFADIELQEKYYDEKIKLFTQKLSIRTLAQIIYETVTSIVAFDFAQITGNIEQQESTLQNHAEQVLENSYAVCRGYTHLTNLLMRTVGIASVYIFGNGHVFNAIFINDVADHNIYKWALIDATWDSGLVVNTELHHIPAKKTPKNYKEQKWYNKVTKKSANSFKQFPDENMSIEAHNKAFINQHQCHEITGMIYKYSTPNGIGEIVIELSQQNEPAIWDITNNCIDSNGKLNIPDEIMSRIKLLVIKDPKILNKISKQSIPRHIRLGNQLAARTQGNCI